MENEYSKKINYYNKILKKYSYHVDFFKTANIMMENMPENINLQNKIIYLNSTMVTAPTLISYVLYILKNAKEKKIKKLYFLARDGYIMHKIAVILCEKYNINIECRYLYCSRLVLRAPLYLINRGEAIEKICEEGAKISIEIVLKRAGISNDIQNNILNELDEEFKNKFLTKKDLNKLKTILLNNKLFNEYAYEYAKDKYNDIFEYFKQEKLFEEKKYAIVDVGWLGTMQRHIREILQYSGYKNNMNGYYFGMFENGRYEDGEYNCFYFSKEKNSSRRAFFNNNLFECMCSANHGMTIGYSKDTAGFIKPVLKQYENKWNVNIQLNIVEKFCEKFSILNQWNEISFNYLDLMVKRLIISFMVFPNKEEASIYGSIPFCDDFTESYKIKLAQRLTKQELYQYNMFYKIYKKLFFIKNSNKFNESFWINGSIQVSDVKYKKIFNLGCILSEYIHYLIIHNLN
ncbi:hypothetical protein FC777_13155 [Clostridium botulinum]|nr:hypothetical protein [Clostridium botulinum]